MKYGIINEDELAFINPRMIDEDEVGTLDEAFIQAKEYIVSGVASKVAIVVAKLEGPDGDGSWVEDLDYPAITIDAEESSWAVEDLEE